MLKCGLTAHVERSHQVNELSVNLGSDEAVPAKHPRGIDLSQFMTLAYYLWEEDDYFFLFTQVTQSCFKEIV